MGFTLGGVMSQGSVPPGWYPDPQELGRQRWWDGTRWGQQAPVTSPWIGGGLPSRNKTMTTIGMAVGVVLGVIGLLGVAVVVLFVVGLNNYGNNK